jgi:hypothetical protein
LKRREALESARQKSRVILGFGHIQHGAGNIRQLVRTISLSCYGIILSSSLIDDDWSPPIILSVAAVYFFLGSKEMSSNPEVNNMESSAATDGSATAQTSNNISPLENGGSSAGLTQGEIIFVTLACFIVAIATLFAIYAVYRKRRQTEADQKTSTRLNNNITTTTVNSPVISIENGISSEMDQYPSTDVGNNMSHESSWRNNQDIRQNRRGTVESTGSVKSRRSSMGSAGSNVSNQYKVAAMNQMRRMSELSEP